MKQTVASGLSQRNLRVEDYSLNIAQGKCERVN